MDGTDLYVYGRVVAVGKDIKGDTVKGIWARSGWGSEVFVNPEPLELDELGTRVNTDYMIRT